MGTNIKQFMEFLYLIFYVCPKFWFLDMESYPGPLRPIPAVCKILCSNVSGLASNLSELTVASSQYDILLCSETLVSDMTHVSQLLVPGIGHPVCLYRGKIPQARGKSAYVYEMVTEHFRWLRNITDVPYLVRVIVVAPIGASDH